MFNPDVIFLHAPAVYDFRQRATLWGPISDLVPSTPVFEMYPIGLTTLAEFLERFGYRTRIINLAVRMLQSQRFDADKYIASLKSPLLFGIDLHWLPSRSWSVGNCQFGQKASPGRSHRVWRIFCQLLPRGTHG